MDHSPAPRSAPDRPSVGRRAVVAGTVWAAPALLAAVPAPALAASPPAGPCVSDPAFSDAAVSVRDATDPAERTAFAVIVDAQSRLSPEAAESGPFDVRIAWTQSQACPNASSPDTGITGLTATARSTTGGSAPTVTTAFTPGANQATASIDVYDPDDVHLFGNTAAGQVTLEFAWPNRFLTEPTCRGLMDVTVTVSYLSTCGPTTETFRTSVRYGNWPSVA